MLKFKPHMSKFFSTSDEQNNAQKVLENLFLLFPKTEVKMVTKEHIFFVTFEDMAPSLARLDSLISDCKKCRLALHKNKTNMDDFRRGYEDYMKEHSPSDYDKGRKRARHDLDISRRVERAIKDPNYFL